MCTVLAAHNVPYTQRLLNNAVNGLGHKLLEVQTIDQALRVCAMESPDLVVTETQFEDGAGHELLRQMWDSGVHCMAIVLADESNNLAKYSWRDLHVFDVMVKPVSLLEISRKIEDALDLTSNHERVIRMLDGIIRRNALALAVV